MNLYCEEAFYRNTEIEKERKCGLNIPKRSKVLGVRFNDSGAWISYARDEFASAVDDWKQVEILFLPNNIISPDLSMKFHKFLGSVTIATAFGIATHQTYHVFVRE